MFRVCQPYHHIIAYNYYLCRIPQEVVLGAGREIVLKNEGFEEDFIEGCTVGSSLLGYHSNENTNPDAV